MKTKKFSGWFQLALCTVITVAFTMFQTSINIANTSMLSAKQVAMSATTYGLAFSVMSFIQGPPQLLLGRAIKKWGPRKPIMLGALITMAAGLTAPSMLNSGTAFVIYFGVLYGIGFLLCTQLTGQTIINNWFFLRRGRAMALARGITMLGSVVGPRIGLLILQKTGSFRPVWYMGAIMGVLIMIAAIIVKEDPSKCGETVDGLAEGETLEKTKEARVSTVYKRKIEDSVLFKDAVKTPRYWMFVAISSIALTTAGLLNATAVHFTNSGADISVISSATSTASIVALFATFGISAIADRIEPSFIFAFAFVGFAVCSLFACLAPTSSVVIYSCYIFCRIISACGFGIMPTLWANTFGAKGFSDLHSFSLLFGGILSSFTGVIAGFICDLTGSYNGVYMVWFVLCAICAVALIFGIGIPCARKYRQEKAEAK